MKKLYVARVKTSEYKAKDGSTKANWETIGNIFENDNGKKFMYLKRYFNPAGIYRLLPYSDKQSTKTAFDYR